MQRRISRRAINRLGFGFAGLLPSKGLAARSQSSSQSTAQDPDIASVQCLTKDDTQCAVDIWEEQFALEPYNDQTREALHLSLMTHALRSLDKGRLAPAQEAFERAKELVPDAFPYAYLREALDRYERVLGVKSSGATFFREVNNSSVETRSVEIPGIMGGQTETFVITSKQPGYQSYFGMTFGAIQGMLGDFALRYLMFPMNTNGSVITVFGLQDEDEYFSANITWSYGATATWNIAHTTGVTSSTWIGEGGSITIDPNQWHWVEIRLRGSTVELWIDFNLVGQQVVLQYEPGVIGIGAGLNAGETGTTFSVAFDDLVAYTLVD